MQEEFTKYKCDHCETVLDIPKGNYGGIFGLYKWITVVMPKENMHGVQKEDTHFCCKECLVNFFDKN